MKNVNPAFVLPLNFKRLLVFSFLVFFGGTYSRADVNTVSCDIYMNAAPLNRTTSAGEENVVSGNYQAVAQQYNALNGQITSVVFWGRVNPSSGLATNTLKVVIYQSNMGLPGAILGSQNVTVDSASAIYQVTAVFASPVNVSGNVIIAVEPFSPSTDNYFIRRNTPPDGQLLHLMKLKQSSQWFQNLAAGDPAYDFDFLILPVTTLNMTAGFTYIQSGNTTNFINNSLNESSWLWDFGDGDTSTASSPSHNYATSGLFPVQLKTFASGPSPCVDSITQNVNVLLTDAGNPPVKKNILSLLTNPVYDRLTLLAVQDIAVVITDILGMEVGKYELKKNYPHVIHTEQLKSGIYFIRSEKISFTKFIKLE